MRKDGWSEMMASLDDDERLVWPRMYFQNRHLYDAIRGVAYIVKDLNHSDAGLDWVWANHLDKLLRQKDVLVLAKQFVVRLRLPWNELKYEWLISQKELHGHREDYQVIDVFLRVRVKDNHTEVVLIDPLEFEINRDKYDVLEVRYLVAWKFGMNPDEKPYWNSECHTRALLDINPDSFTTWMQQ